MRGASRGAARGDSDTETVSIGMCALPTGIPGQRAGRTCSELNVTAAAIASAAGRPDIYSCRWLSCTLCTALEQSGAPCLAVYVPCAPPPRACLSHPAWCGGVPPDAPRPRSGSAASPRPPRRASSSPPAPPRTAAHMVHLCTFAHPPRVRLPPTSTRR